MNFNWLIKSENLCEYNKKEWEKIMTQRKFIMNRKSRNLILFFQEPRQACHIQWWWFKICFLFIIFSLIHLHKFLSNIIIMYTLLLLQPPCWLPFSQAQKKPKVSSTKISLFSLHYLVAILLVCQKKSQQQQQQLRDET